MRLDKQLYLILERVKSSHRVRITPDLRDVLTRWTASTRLSPIYSIDRGTGEVETGRTFRFRGGHVLVLLGPIHPDEVAACVSPDTRLWATFGLLNNIVLPASEVEQRRLLKLAKKKKVAFELWRLKDGILRSHEQSETGEVGDIGAKLGRLAVKSVAAEVREALHEYCPLMASTCARGLHLPPYIRNNLVRTHDYVEQTIRDSEIGSNDLTPYRVLGQMLTINAGLSRFSSQTFAGTIPVTETECHFWSHSLLGIGVASIGLCRLTEFLELTLGKADLPQRFEQLSRVTREVPDLCKLDVNHPFWTTDHLGRAIPESNSGSEPIVPLLSYFSARDGFRSTLTTLSAPLASVSSCNSPRWSLLTITHEISHILVRALLAKIYPDMESPEEVYSTIELLDRDHGSNLLEEIRRFLLITVWMLDNVHGRKRQNRDIDADLLKKLIENWQREVEEVLVHVFDFLYFYGKDVTKYVNGIWASWGTIPNISTRIPDYVVRTISSVLTNHLRRPEGAEVARDLVVTTLSELQKTDMGGDYVETALNYIRDHWQDEIRERVLARKGLVKIAQTFLFSESIATSVRGEPEIRGGATEKEGYSLRMGHLELKIIRNPLRFLELYSVSSQPSSLESLWIYLVLAFGVAR
jgi:hypothetical protein